MYMYNHNETDETLVLLTLAGEQTAYEVLVMRYQQTVTAVAMAVTKNWFTAQDAAQDAFVTAWMKLDTLQEQEKYCSWVCRIAKNCALNMLQRYRSFLPLDTADQLGMSDGSETSPAVLYEQAEERREIRKSVMRLPERVQAIIRLHYFENLSIAEIADRMRISEGTVKWQLHDGRKRIRKELCAMNEKYSDTLVQRVMKKVEELKLWQLKNDKSGFAAAYQEVLREVEAMPECSKKQHALADVLMRGWWWLPGKKNDALFARIARAAMEGHNEEVMIFIVTREDAMLHGSALIEFMKSKQIPRLEKAGFQKTLGREWFWLGYRLCRAGKPKEGRDAYHKAELYLKPSDVYRVLVPDTLALETQLATRYQNTAEEKYLICAVAEEYRRIDGHLRFWTEEGIREGGLLSIDDIDRRCMHLYRNASGCDGYFFQKLAPGEIYTGTDGSTLRYLSEDEVAETPAGRFSHCQLWEVRRWTLFLKIVCRTFYKDGVGIVRQENVIDGVKYTRVLKSYVICGGKGMLPFYPGNTWEYISEDAGNGISSELKTAVSYADEGTILLSCWENTERTAYDETVWSDMVQKIAREYHHSDTHGNLSICDVSESIERAEQLAVTPMQKAHTKAAASAARRIMDTDTGFHPDTDVTGHWNFFERQYIRRKGGVLLLTEYNPRWSFEWKKSGVMGLAGEPIFYNSIFGILRDVTNCIWSDAWQVGASEVEYTRGPYEIRTRIRCEDGGTITTRAGRFEHCLKLCLDTKGLDGGLYYQNGKKAYYFAEGMGIVRAEFEYSGGAGTAVYELCSYEGTGEGFMPVADGLVRRYEARDLTDGFAASAEYAFVADEDGDIVVFSDRTGIRRTSPAITQYSSILNEVTEDRLWEAGKRAESRLRHDVNNFHLLCHFLGRPTRYWGKPEKAAAWNKYRLQIMEGLGGGTVPDAWLGMYASTSFRTACALFGCGEKEEGYAWLDKAFAAYDKWDNIAEESEMQAGDPLIYGEIRVVKGKSKIILPDGTSEPVSYGDLFEGDSSLMHYGLTAPFGWEWFNSVRGEERYGKAVERAKRMMENNP